MNARTAFVIVCLMLALNPSAATAESITGNQYLELSSRDSGWYFLGILDAMKQTRDQYLKNSELDQEEFDRLWNACISGRPIRQHVAIVETWLTANPSRWQEPAIELIFAAVKDSCEEINALNEETQ